MIVVDASALVDAFIGDVAAADRLSGEELHAPHLIDLEVANALQRLESAGVVAGADAARFVSAMQNLNLYLYGHAPLLGRIWALRGAVNPYDAAYVALAAALDVPLITTDRKLAAVPGLPCTIELV